MRCYLYILIILSLFFVSCEKDGGGGGNGLSADTSYPEIKNYRTIIAYMGMDDGSFLANKMSGHTVKLFVENWKKEHNNTFLMYVDAGKESYLIEVTEKSGKNVADTVRRYGKENSADPEVLRRVLTEVTEGWPAQSYGMIVSSHGSGWLPPHTMSTPYSVAPKSIIVDKGSGSKEMDIKDFAAAIPCYLDFLIMDVCLMGAVEVAYELKDKASYLVFSPAEVLSDGMVFPQTLAHITKTEPDLKGFAKEFYEYYDKQEENFRSATISVIQTSALEGLAQISSGLLKDVVVEDKIIWEVQTFGYGNNKLYFDFGDFIHKLRPDKYNEFMKALDKAVICKYNTPKYYSAGTYDSRPISAFCGLSIYIPQSHYPYVNSEYKKTQWDRRINNSLAPAGNEKISKVD